MSSVQVTIPFKSRKKTYVECKNGKKANNENWDQTNVLTTKERRKLKRPIEEDFNNDIDISDEETCSPTKVSRLVTKAEKHSEQDDGLDVCSGAGLKPLPSREAELAALGEFLLGHAREGTAGAMYVSGQPGTGKTACLTYLLQTPEIRESYKQVYVNCTTMKSAASVYARVCRELQLRASGEKACRAAIENYLTKKHKMILLVLDEIDQLDSKRQAVLYTIFEWPSLAGSRLVLVGVANALDLTQRALPRLQRGCLRPRTLHFAPYTRQQIVDIFTSRLADEDKGSVFSPVALQMLAAKIAAVSGDMRRALDIGRRVVELARRTQFPATGDVAALRAAAPVELRQVLQVLDTVYAGAASLDAAVEDGLPMQQKLILCTLMLMLTKGNNKDVTLGKLHDVYKRVASKRNISPLDAGELLSVCGLLEARGALRLGGGGGGARARKLRLQWDEADLAAAMRDQPLLADVLRDASCLAPR